MLNSNAIICQNVVLLLFLGHCALIGFAVNRQLRLWQDTKEPNSNLYLQWFFALSIGMLANIALLFFLGIVGWLTLNAVLTGEFALLLSAICIFVFYRPLGNSIKDIHFGLGNSLQLLALLAFFLVLMLSAIKAPGLWDDTSYHLPNAQFYIKNHAISLNVYNRLPLFPQNIDLLFVFGLMMNGVLLAQAMATLPLFIIGIGLIGAGIWLMGSKIPGILSIVLMLSLAPVQYSLGYAYIDNGLALFCWGALLALAVWVGSHQRAKSWIIIAGMLAGGAAGCKYFGLAFACMLGAYLLIICRNYRAALTYAITLFAFGSWWYLHSMIISGDPIHPLGAKIFGYFLWNAQDLVGVKNEQASHGVHPSIFTLWPALLKAGVYLWVLAFFSLFFFTKAKSPIRLMQVIFLSYFFFWFFATQVDRYLSPIFALGSFLSAGFLYKVVIKRYISALISKKPWLNNPTIPAGICLAILLPFSIVPYHTACYQLTHWNEILQGRSGYTLYQKANTLIPAFGPRVVQLGFENGIYFFDGLVIGDWVGPARYSDMAFYQGSWKVVAAAQMDRIMEKFNSHILLINKKEFDIDTAAYEKYFTLQQEDELGVLLTKK